MALDARWTKTIDDGFRDDSKGKWSGIVLSEVTQYNIRLANTQDYVPVNWKLVLAMLWVESVGPKMPAWNGRVMQIGNPGDPGYSALKKHDGATELIVREELLKRIDASNAKELGDPIFNIMAGIAYLFVRMAISDVASLPDTTDTAAHEHKVQAGEVAAKIAGIEGTTTEDIQASNPGVNIAKLHPGQVLQFHKAHMGRRITGWRTFEPNVIAKQYNVGDPSYAEKLRYVLDKLNGK